MFRIISTSLAVIGIAGAVFAAAPEQRPADESVESPSTMLAHSMLPAEEAECRVEATASPSRQQESRLADLVRQHRVVSRLSINQDSWGQDETMPAKEQPSQGHCS